VPYRRERESKEKYCGQKHCRRIDSPVSTGQAAGEDVGGVECRVAHEPPREPEVDGIAAVEVGCTPPEPAPRTTKVTPISRTKCGLKGPVSGTLAGRFQYHE
jgi:hypothetical protein